MIESRPRHQSRMRSCICAVSTSKVCAHGGRACCKDPRLIICRGIYCLRSSLSHPSRSLRGSRPRDTAAVGSTDSKETGAEMSARLLKLDQKGSDLTPGTVLVREWDRRSQRVMVMSDGFAWNGQTYDSLSKVAFAITGTKWNGPRFFGLRDKEERSATEAGS